MLSAHRLSSVRQYESCWSRFQHFLRVKDVPQVTTATVLHFLAWLVNAHYRAPTTVSAHHTVLVDPLRFGLGITVPQRELTLLLWGIRTSRPVRRPPLLEWSLHKVLTHLSFEGATIDTTLSLQTAVFLLARASGYRSSQLVAFTRHPAFTHWSTNGMAVTITPSPTFMAKSEQADSLIGPLRIPALLKNDQHLPLCPVKALSDYIDRTRGVSTDYLFYNPRSQKALTPRSIATLLCNIIEAADPGHAPRAHSIWGLATSVAFLRTHSTERVRDLGGWASTVSFRTRYLRHSVSRQPCVARCT